jgi:hypothetical protein
MAEEEATSKFTDIIDDFRNDLFTTFPELRATFTATNEECEEHCRAMYPKLFFEILYENNTLFEDHPMLLPNVDFKILMTDEGVSDKTRKTIWKYLQLIVFSVLEKMDDASGFGETSHLFEAIRDEDLQKKIAESMEEMKSFFDPSSANFEDVFSSFKEEEGDEGGGAAAEGKAKPKFSPEDMKSHLDGLMKGKIGSLAKEIALDAQEEMGEMMDNPNFMQNMMKNPKKVLDLVKNIGSKVEKKIKAGELKESELLEEASDIMKQIKDIPGLKDVFSKMGMNPANMDFKGMANKMNENMKQARTKERLNRKREERCAERAAAAAAVPKDVQLVEESEDTVVFRVEGNTKKASSSPPPSSSQKKKKKNKK